MEMWHMLSMALILGVLVLILNPMGEDASFPIGLILLVMPIALLARIEYWLRQSKRFLEYSQVVTVTDDSIEIKDSAGNTRVLTFSTMVKARFLWGYLVVYVTKRSKSFYPLRAFSTEQTEQISALLRSKHLMK
jgi:hypothetical protein